MWTDILRYDLGGIMDEDFTSSDLKMKKIFVKKNFKENLFPKKNRRKIRFSSKYPDFLSLGQEKKHRVAHPGDEAFSAKPVFLKG